MSETSDGVVELLCELVRIDSVNPDLVPGGAGEEQIGGFVAEWLQTRGCQVEIQPVEPGRVNVIATLPGTGGGRRLLLNSHMDTVGVAAVTDPFTPVMRDGRLYGRGAGDTKGGLAAGMWAMAELASAASRRGDVVLAAVADEECGSKGTERLVRTMRADASIVLEPHDLNILTAHKGFVWLTVVTHGRAAHGSRPDLGRDAISYLGRVIVELERLDRRLRESDGHPFVGTGSLHCGLVSGGQELSSYPEEATLRVERRTVPGESVATVLGEVEEILDELTRADPEFDASVTVDFSREPLLVAQGEPIVDLLARHVEAVTGRRPALDAGTGWTDAALQTEHGIPSIVFGPAADGIHGAVESVDLRSVDACAQTLVAVAEEFCQ